MDYSKLEKEYVRVWRKVNPATLFMVLVYAYMRRLYSSQQIEEACRTDIRFMWILGMESAPDHSTIARFQNERLAPVIEDLFYQLIHRLVKMGEVSYTNVFVDGTKIEANANKYSFVWAKAVEKYLNRLESKIEMETQRIPASSVSSAATLLPPAVLPYIIRFALQLRLDCLFKPQVQHVVQIYVCEYRRDQSALRRSAIAVF